LPGGSLQRNYAYSPFNAMYRLRRKAKMACIVRMMMRMTRRRRRRLRMNLQGFKLSQEQEHNIFHPLGIFK